MSKLDLKTLMLSWALALWAQNVFASSPLPCPKGSPINDTIWVLQSDVKSNVQNRLMQIDREKFHQIVIITVNSPEEYGYDTLARMWADTINKCGIGYRGENTGTIVWYSNNFDADKNKYFIATASGVSWYITDNLARRLVASSKETCDKVNVSCRMDDITKGLDAIITKHLAWNQQVQVIQEGIKAHDQKQASDSMENILQMLGLWGLVILVVGWGIKIQNNLTASKKRRELKKKILELSVKFKQEKAKYPDWFINSHMRKDEYKLNELQSQTDEQLNTICRFQSEYHNVNNVILSNIEKNLVLLAGQYKDIIEWVETQKKNLSTQISIASWLYATFDKEWYQYNKISLHIPEGKSNPEATLQSYDQMISLLQQHIKELSEIPRIYKKFQWFDTKVSGNFTKLKNEFEVALGRYEGIFWNWSSKFSFSTLETEMLTLIAWFQSAYQKKNISALQEYKKQSEAKLSSFESTILNMNNQISWYEWLPREISALETRLEKYTPSQEYVKNAKAYRDESWSRKFDGYNMSEKLKDITTNLLEIKRKYNKREWLTTLQKVITNISNELNMMQEYVWLWIVVTTLIAQRIAEEAREAERRRRQAEADAEAARLQAIEDAKPKTTTTSSSSSFSDDTTPSFSPGWWGWWDGWWGWGD